MQARTFSRWKSWAFIMSLNPLLGNARQLREFVVRAVQRMPAGEDRIKYDHLFSPGDPENKAFWLEAVSVAGDLENRYVALLDESLAISSELGMRPLMERVGARQERAEASPGRSPAYPDGLTRREVEVLRLVCGGKTDREIGEALFISVKTVGNHVSNILNKTGVANRAEAAAYAVRRGLEG